MGWTKILTASSTNNYFCYVKNPLPYWSYLFTLKSFSWLKLRRKQQFKSPPYIWRQSMTEDGWMILMKCNAYSIKKGKKEKTLDCLFFLFTLSRKFLNIFLHVNKQGWLNRLHVGLQSKIYIFLIPISVTLSILFLLFMAHHGGIPLPSKGKVGKNWSTRSKTTVRSKRVGPLGSNWAPLLGSHSDIL